MRVLVVEDVHRLADDIAEGMRDQGIAADISYDGPDALKKLAINAYDVVILDRDLPGVHGDVICRTIAEGDNSVMVLMLTASGTPGDRVSGLGLGADDYLSKPFHFPELVLRVRSLGRRRVNTHPLVLKMSGIELDPLRRSALREGAPLELSVKELAVLEALMKASPGYLSAEALLEQVWDENADPFTKTVQVTISRLRRKLGEPQVIETLPAVGYRMMVTIQDDGPSAAQAAAATMEIEAMP